MTREPLKIADVRIEVVRRELPDTPALPSRACYEC